MSLFVAVRALMFGYMCITVNFSRRGKNPKSCWFKDISLYHLGNVSLMLHTTAVYKTEQNDYKIERSSASAIPRLREGVELLKTQSTATCDPT